MEPLICKGTLQSIAEGWDKTPGESLRVCKGRKAAGRGGDSAAAPGRDHGTLPSRVRVCVCVCRRVYVQEACARGVSAKILGLPSCGGSEVPSVGMCVKVGRKFSRCGGRVRLAPLFLHEDFPSPRHFRFFLFPPLWPKPGRLAGYGHFAAFIANYSRINQSSRWGLSLGIGICVTGHMPGTDEVGSAAARGEGLSAEDRQPRLGPVPKKRRPRLYRARSQGRLFSTEPAWGAVGGAPGLPKGDLWRVAGEWPRIRGPAGGEGGEPQEPRPRGQQMRGRCDVPRRGGKAAVGAGRPCDVNVGRPRPAGPSPAPLRSVICQGARGVVPGPARFDIHLPSPAIVSFRAPERGW